MDYIRLKKTLIAAFDHFLSCHNINELEEMMQALEVGKSLVIKLPEPIDREDYSDDVLGHEEQRKNDDVRGSKDKKYNVAYMETSRPKKIVSRVRRKKPKAALKIGLKEIKICDVSVLLDLTKISKEKRKTVQNTLEGAHKITLSDVKVSDMHGFAKARIFKLVQGENNISSHEMFHAVQHSIPSSSKVIPNHQNNHITASSLENKNISVQKK